MVSALSFWVPWLTATQRTALLAVYAWSMAHTISLNNPMQTALGIWRYRNRKLKQKKLIRRIIITWKDGKSDYPKTVFTFEFYIAASYMWYAMWMIVLLILLRAYFTVFWGSFQVVLGRLSANLIFTRIGMPLWEDISGRCTLIRTLGFAFIAESQAFFFAFLPGSADGWKRGCSDGGWPWARANVSPRYLSKNKG